MAAIYAYASVVIIAADGLDADHGLRGLKGADGAVPRQVEQDIISFGDESLIHRHDYEMYGKSSPQGYYSRSWTYQEYAFARRRICFERGRVQFECLETTRVEDCGKSFISTHVSNVDEVTTMTYPDPATYYNMAAEFNQRQLTFPEDCLSAFAGINSVSADRFTDGILCGLPEMFFDVALLWQPDGDLVRRISSKPIRPSMTKQECSIPSWSWIGWAGALRLLSWASANDFVAFSERGGACTLCETIVTTKWYTGKSPSGQDRRPVNVEWDACRQLFKDSHEPEPPGWTKLRLPTGMPHYPPPSGYGEYVWRNEAANEWFWYPVPLLNLSKPSSESTLATDAGYLFANVRATRLYSSGEEADLDLSQAVVFEEAEPGSARVFLYTSSGNWAGILILHNREDLGFLASHADGSRKDIDLVAISRGFLPNYLEYGNEIDEYFASERPKDGKFYEFYNVLWIEWKDGIAYRKALGRVEKSRWESLDGKMIDLVLG